MTEVTNHKLGLAIWLVTSSQAQLKNLNGNDLGLRKIGLYKLRIQPHMEEQNSEILDLVDFEDGRFATFVQDPEFDFLVDSLIKLLKQGRFIRITALQNCSNSFDGCVVDLDWPMTFHEKVSAAKLPLVWRYGSFLAVADLDPSALGFFNHQMPLEQKPDDLKSRIESFQFGSEIELDFDGSLDEIMEHNANVLDPYVISELSITEEQLADDDNLLGIIQIRVGEYIKEKYIEYVNQNM